MMNRSLAAVIVLLLPCAAYVAVMSVTEWAHPLSNVPTGREKRAALAIRDNVTPFQKWGTHQFTAPYLDRYYDRVWYFTQARSGDSKGEFLAALNTALERYPEVDLFLLAHSNHYIRWVAEVPPAQRAHLRLIYNTGCYDLTQGADWMQLGAKAYVSHPGESASPVFYFYFLRRWSRGMPLKEAKDDSNDLMSSALKRGEVSSFGKLNAAQIAHESEAFSYGNTTLRIQSGTE
ncbi:MAG: hypothetical protein JWN14_3816 [Chthonomonadales bacterium]|nr:hypothetical protein [Chthonomonadales bacterium]